MPEQHFTQPPPRFIRGVAGQGAGGEGHRPPVDLREHPVDDPGPRLRREDEKRRFHPTELGMHGQRPARRVLPRHPQRRRSPRGWRTSSTRSRRARQTGSQLLRRFYAPFKIDLEQGRGRDARRQARGAARPSTCARSAASRWSSSGAATASSSPARGYPECKNTKEFMRDEDGTITVGRGRD